jgi:hypothetical protein
MDTAAQKSARGEYYGSRPVGPTIQRHNTIYTSPHHQELGDGALSKFHFWSSLQLCSHSSAVEAAIALGTGRPYRRTFGAVQHPELYAGLVGGPAHHATESIYLSHNGSLGNPTDGRIARHLAYRLEVLGQQESTRTTTPG